MINEYCVNRFCKDDISKIENYDKAIADTTQTWSCHHRLELTLDGELAHTKEELIRMNMYYNRPYFELIFLTHKDHDCLHKKGKKVGIETRARMSVAMKGNINGAGNKGRKFSEEHIVKLSASHKGQKFTEETRAKISAANKGKNHGPMSEETRAKISAAKKGKRRSV